MPNILITGASRGLGLGFARHFAAAGWRVFATCRNPAEAADLAGVAAEAGGQLTIDTLDVDDFDAIAALAAKLSGTPIDVLINNAGFKGDTPQGFGVVNYHSWAAVLHTNVLSVMKMTETFITNVAASERKLIVMVSSGLSSMTNKSGPEYGEGELYIYRSSKAGLNMLTKGLSLDLAERGVTVVGIGPGWVRTGIGGPHAKFSVEESMANVCPMIENFTMKDTGKLYLYDGNELPW
jgi:NAD(P)-dependent dehydrogenase (short-subunit alcohol dehydrogenase family)